LDVVPRHCLRCSYIAATMVLVSAATVTRALANNMIVAGQIFRRYRLIFRVDQVLRVSIKYREEILSESAMKRELLKLSAHDIRPYGLIYTSVRVLPYSAFVPCAAPFCNPLPEPSKERQVSRPLICRPLRSTAERRRLCCPRAVTSLRLTLNGWQLFDRVRIWLQTLVICGSFGAWTVVFDCW